MTGYKKKHFKLERAVMNDMNSKLYIKGTRRPFSYLTGTPLCIKAMSVPKTGFPALGNETFKIRVKYW